MISVAVIGPDGAGKTTVARALESALPLPAKYLYMGINPEASNVMLPTTRALLALRRRLGIAPNQGGPRDPGQAKAATGNPVKRVLKGVKASLGMANRLAEEWYRHQTARSYQRRGYVVLFDRHFYVDYYAYDIAGDSGPKPLLNRLHGWALRRVFSRPDLVIYLDAPAAVLFARKGEGTVELLERRRQDYLQLGSHLPHFTVVDASRPLEAVLADVSERIQDFHRTRAADG